MDIGREEVLKSNIFCSYEDMSTHKTLMAALGKGMAGLWAPGHVNQDDLPMYVHSLTRNSNDLPNIKPVTVIGRQPESDVWVLNDDVQLNKNGDMIADKDRRYCFVNDSLRYLYSDIAETADCNNGMHIKQMIRAMKATMGESFYPALLMLGGGIVAFHYTTLMDNLSDPSVPLILATGPPAT